MGKRYIVVLEDLLQPFGLMIVHGKDVDVRIESPFGLLNFSVKVLNISVFLASTIVLRSSFETAS